MSAFVRFAVMFAVVCVGPACSGQEGTDARQQYEAVRGQNCLVCAGHQPFHIRISAQLFSLEGDPAGTGTVEEWWASPGRYRIETTGADGKQVQTGAPAATLPAVRRSNYLLRLLLDQSVNPMPPLSAAASVTTSDRLFGGTSFRCFAVARKAVTETATEPLYCTEPGKSELRINNPSMVEGGVRNQLAPFHGAFVSLKTGIRFGDRQAVTGEVKALQVLDPETSSFAELHSSPADAAADKREETESSGILPGHVVSRPMPRYPVEMRSVTPQGIVVLGLVISRGGHVASIDTLASPAPALARAATEAVRTWTFSPYTQDGTPVEAPTDVLVNFAIGR